MATIIASKLIDLSLKDLSVYASGETIGTDDAADALEYLNIIIRKLRGMGMTIPCSTAVSASMVSGTNSYVIGDGETLDTPKPLEVIYAAVRDSAGIDNEVSIVDVITFESIPDKATQDRPVVLSYRRDTATGAGKVYLWPTPNTTDTLRLEVLGGPDTEPATGAATLVVPDECQSYMRRALAIDLSVVFGKELPQWYFGMFQEEERQMKAFNASRRAPQADLSYLPGCAQGRGDINNPWRN